ncbi:MAG TPA: NlpC/P60 family protein [Acidimicrobiales bacterium]|nr:NlpC/P60 family protein [Acidimicrobiales bacterium]
MLGLVGAGASGLAGIAAPGAGATGATTPTTTPGPAPNQAQLNATKAQVASVEATLTQEEQQSQVLDGRYDTAVEALQNAQNALQAIDANIVRTKAAVATDKRHLANDALKAYIYATPETKFDSLFSNSANLNSARDQYNQQIVGNLNQARDALQAVQSQLVGQKAQQQSAEAQAQSEASQAKSLALANQQAAAQTKQTLSQVQGQFAQEVAQAAVEEAQQEAAAAAKAATAAQAQKAAAAAAAAAAIAGAVGGSASGAAATTAANQAGAGSHTGASGPVGGTGSGSGGQMTAVQAAVSQLGVPYVFGGNSPATGFDCSGLVQWAWARAGVSIPRTTESQWPDLPHVSLSALEPGDLLYYYNLDGDSAVDHVVMYVGSGPYGTDTVIQAPFTGSTVSYSPIFTSGLIGAARP